MRNAGNIVGAARAEADAQMLATAFVETADYRTLTETTDFNFVVGRRGTGKSALHAKVTSTFRAARACCVLQPSPKSSSYSNCNPNFAAPSVLIGRCVPRPAWLGRCTFSCGFLATSRTTISSWVVTSGSGSHAARRDTRLCCATTAQGESDAFCRLGFCSPIRHLRYRTPSLNSMTCPPSRQM